MSIKDKHFQVYSMSDGWEIQVIQIPGNGVLGRWTWDHNEVELGVGGERLVADILKYLGYSVYEEDVY